MLCYINKNDSPDRDRCVVKVDTHPSLSQGALQGRQLAHGTPGLCDQALISDGWAAEIQHGLHGLTLLNLHNPLGQTGQRSHQQLLHVLLRLTHDLQPRRNTDTRGGSSETVCLQRLTKRKWKNENVLTVINSALTDLMSSILPRSPLRVSSRSAWLSG